METISRSLEGATMPDKACDHLLRGGFTSLPIKEHPRCANCSTYLCSDCQDSAVHCHSHGSTCLGIICVECQKTARKRQVGCQCVAPQSCKFCEFYKSTGGKTLDYLCAPCCAKQDSAQKMLVLEIGAMWSKIPAIHTSSDAIWLDDIVDKLEAALEKAKEAL